MRTRNVRNRGYRARHEDQASGRGVRCDRVGLRRAGVMFGQQVRQLIAAPHFVTGSPGPASVSRARNTSSLVRRCRARCRPQAFRAGDEQLYELQVRQLHGQLKRCHARAVGSWARACRRRRRRTGRSRPAAVRCWLVVSRARASPTSAPVPDLLGVRTWTCGGDRTGEACSVPWPTTSATARYTPSSSGFGGGEGGHRRPLRARSTRAARR